MRYWLAACVLVAASGALPLNDAEVSAVHLSDEAPKGDTFLRKEITGFFHDQEDAKSSNALRGVFRNDASSEAARQLKELAHTDQRLGESFDSDSAREEERSADAAEKKGEQVAQKAMHDINKMEKDVDAKAKLKKSMREIKKEAKEAQRSAVQQLKKIKPHELGESPAAALNQAKAEEKKALRKINSMEKKMDEQAQIDDMKAKQMKAVAAAVKSIGKHAENTAKNMDTERQTVRTGELGDAPSSEKSKANAAIKKAQQEAERATAKIKKLEKDLSAQAALQKDMQSFAHEASAAAKSVSSSISSVKGSHRLGSSNGEDEQKDASYRAKQKHLDEEEMKAKAFEKKTISRFQKVEDAFVRKAKTVARTQKSLAEFKKAAAAAAHLTAGNSDSSKVTELGDNFDATEQEDTLSGMATDEAAKLIHETNAALTQFAKSTSNEISAIVKSDA